MRHSGDSVYACSSCSTLAAQVTLVELIRHSSGSVYSFAVHAALERFGLLFIVHAALEWFGLLLQPIQHSSSSTCFCSLCSARSLAVRASLERFGFLAVFAALEQFALR